MFKILSASSISLLEQRVAKYKVTTLGSLVVSNGQFYLAIIGEVKEKPKVNPSKPKEEEPKPKTKRKPKAKAKPKA